MTKSMTDADLFGELERIKTETQRQRKELPFTTVEFEIDRLKHRLTALEATCVRKMATKEDVVAGKASGDRAADARARRADEIRAEYSISFVYRDGRRDALRVTCRGVYLAEFPYLGEERIPPDNMAERFIAAEVDHRLREEADHG